ncbi:hypothetical protein ACFL35_02370 [Candidatus Riflebacteria bacterium]
MYKRKLVFGVLALFFAFLPSGIYADFGPTTEDAEILGDVSGTEEADKYKDDHGNLKPDFDTPKYLEQKLGTSIKVELKDLSISRNEYKQSFLYNGWAGARGYGKLGEIKVDKVSFHETIGKAFKVDWGYKKGNSQVVSGWSNTLKWSHTYPTDGIYTVKVQMRQGGIKHQWYEVTEKVQKTTKPETYEVVSEKPPFWQHGDGNKNPPESFRLINQDMWIKTNKVYNEESKTERPLGIYKRHVRCDEWVSKLNETLSSITKKDTWSEEAQENVPIQLTKSIMDFVSEPPMSDKFQQLWAKLNDKGRITEYQWKPVTTKFSVLKEAGGFALIKEPNIKTVPFEPAYIPNSDYSAYLLKDMVAGIKFQVTLNEKIRYVDTEKTFVIKALKDASATSKNDHGDPNPKKQFSIVEKSFIISIYKPLPTVSGSSLGLTLSPTVMDDTRQRIIHCEEDKPVTVTIGDIGKHIKGSRKNFGKYKVWEPSARSGNGGIGPYGHMSSWRNYADWRHKYHQLYWGGWSSYGGRYRGYGWHRRIYNNNPSKNPKWGGKDLYQYYYTPQYFGNVNVRLDWGDGKYVNKVLSQSRYPEKMAPNVTRAGSVQHTFYKNGRYNGKVTSSFTTLNRETTYLQRYPVKLYRWVWVYDRYRELRRTWRWAYRTVRWYWYWSHWYDQVVGRPYWGGGAGRGRGRIVARNIYH